MIYIEGVGEQLRVFVYSLGLGAILCAVYDIFKIIRNTFRFKKVGIFLHDFLYCLIFSIFTFIYMLIMNNGSFRFYILLGESVGFSAYYFTLGRLLKAAYMVLNKKFNVINLTVKRAVCKLKSKILPIKYFNALKNRFAAKKGSINAK